MVNQVVDWTKTGPRKAGTLAEPNPRVLQPSGGCTHANLIADSKACVVTSSHCPTSVSFE